MNRPYNILLLLPLLSFAVAACGTKNVALYGYATPPDGTLLLEGNTGLRFEAVMDLDAPQTFRFRFNGQYGVIDLGVNGPYDYLTANVDEWISGDMNGASLPPGSYIVDLVDASGQIWATTPTLDVQQPASPIQGPTVIFVHLDGRAETWILDQATQDSDPTTMETTVSNLSGGDVTVNRCMGTGGLGSSLTCTPLGTVAAGDDFQTVETITTAPVTPATPVSTLTIGSYQSPTETNGYCQVERIVYTGIRTLRNGSTTSPGFAACNGF